MPSRSMAVVTAEAVVFMVVEEAVSTGAVVVASMGAAVLAADILAAARVWAGLPDRLFAAEEEILAGAHWVADARLMAAVLSLAHLARAEWAPVVVPFQERAAPELRTGLLTDNGILSAGHAVESLEVAREAQSMTALGIRLEERAVAR
jgi:hypothetical protein